MYRNIYGCGIRIALKNDYDVECLAIVQVETETVWASISFKDQRKLIVGFFYWPPENPMQPINHFESVILDVVHKLKNNPNCTLILAVIFLAQYMNTFKVNKLKSELQT